MENTSNFEDEIDLRALLATLSAGKYIIAGVLVVFMLIGSLYLHRVDREYTVTMTLRPVSGDGEAGASLPSGIGGLASLAGISLQSGLSSDFDAFQMLLRSSEVAGRLFKHEDLTKVIFAHEWDADKGAFVAPARGVISGAVSVLKFILVGDSAEYIPPNAGRLSKYISQSLGVTKMADSGYLVLSMEHAQPELAVELMTALVAETDMLLKERYIISGANALGFYQAKIEQTRSQAHRDALVGLIAKEEHKLMLASRDGAFVAEPVLNSETSLRPTSPNSTLILMLTIVMGLFAGGGIVIVGSMMSQGRKDKNRA